MTKTKSTKSALMLSALAILLCVSMLVGSTFAWFTDSVSSANNIIKSGNLDVVLEYWDGDSWENVQDKSDVLTNTLFEPGVTEVAYLRVANAGSLAFKYQLGINVLSETEGVNQAGNKFRLSNYIMFGVVEGVNGATDAYTKDDAGRAEAIADLTDAKKIYEGYTKAATIAAKADPTYFALVVYMPTSVDNVANHNGTDIPQIDLGINVFATQYTKENDSFNDQYDVNAPFSVWNGIVPTEMPESLVVDGATQTIHVKDADAFAYLSTLSAKWVELYTDGKGTTYTNYANGAGANYYYSGSWTISLEADIDLNNHEIDPIAIVIGQGTGATAFDGNGHTIRNINATTGLFADGNRASYANLTLENVKASNGALAGISNHSITNVTVKNAAISGTDYVGGLVGKTYSSITRCKVVDSFIVASGKEAGGLVGYAEANSKGSTITNNVVSNVSVYANNRAAGLVAQSNTTVKVYNNTVENVTVGATDITEYQSGAVVSNALAPANVYDNTVSNCTFNDEKTAKIADDATELKDAIKNGTKNDIIYAEGVVVDGTTKLNTGATVIGATFSNSGGNAVTSTVNGTFKDCVFTGYNGLRGCYAGETVVFENCVFDGSVYGVHFDGGANDAVFKNCTFSGFNAMGSAITKLTMEGCTFKSNGKSGYNGINLWGSTDMINCTFVFDGTASTEWVDAVGDNKTYTFEGCVISDGTTERALSTSDVGNYGTGNTITIK